METWVAECLNRVGIGAGSPVIVRSSGTSETMEKRGQLASQECFGDQIVSSVHKLVGQVAGLHEGQVHWIVQEYIAGKKGHLSNERHLSYEPRDWVAEFEADGSRPSYLVPIAVRMWRDGEDSTEVDLRCNSEAEVSIRLKRVAMWATKFATRIHFEWVWDGRSIRIVQSDSATPKAGTTPKSLLPEKIDLIRPDVLHLFRLAAKEDYERYGKLSNAGLYAELGYGMPEFYVLDNVATIASLLEGQIPPDLVEDLKELTRRPLIIRTDGTAIPREKREMLPRSEELRSASRAQEWLSGCFRSQIQKGDLANGSLSLIAHHFIPSVASAWARAKPGDRLVRIESLWGLPEGLYWYSHDTFEVNTGRVEVDFSRPAGSTKYPVRERLRFKKTLIAPDPSGRWLPHIAGVPFDWQRSIRRRRWLFEIADTTRRVAEREGNEVCLMWFIDNHPQATHHKVLPWFHAKTSLLGHPKAAPRRKRVFSKDFSIASNADWQRLREEVAAGHHTERVIVEPVDPDLIRNDQFLKDLAALASTY